jgi:hypothetical protein
MMDMLFPQANICAARQKEWKEQQERLAAASDTERKDESGPPQL